MLLPFLDPIIDRIPNPNERAQAREELESKIVDAETKGLLGQLEINKVEAQHRSLFVAGWRPSIGWVCGFAFAYHFVLLPFLLLLIAVGSEVYGWDFDASQLPELEMESLMTVLMGMLGLGTLRTFEKVKKVSV